VTDGVWVCVLLNAATLGVVLGAVFTLLSQRRRDRRETFGSPRSKDGS